MTQAEPHSPSPAGDDPDLSGEAHAPGEVVPRKRPKPGERRVQILQTLASMLEQPGSERVTTAALAARLSVSEAALYRHFASKAQMFEGLIEFIEQSVFSLVTQITQRDDAPATQAYKLVNMLMQFGEKNPGMARVMVGDASSGTGLGNIEKSVFFPKKAVDMTSGHSGRGSAMVLKTEFVITGALKSK